MFKPKSVPAPDRSIRLRSLLQSRGKAWLLALLLGLITVLAAVTLLALSGWFISAAALAGLAGSLKVLVYRAPAVVKASVS